MTTELLSAPGDCAVKVKVTVRDIKGVWSEELTALGSGNDKIVLAKKGVDGAPPHVYLSPSKVVDKATKAAIVTLTNEQAGSRYKARSDWVHMEDEEFFECTVQPDDDQPAFVAYVCNHPALMGRVCNSQMREQCVRLVSIRICKNNGFSFAAYRGRLQGDFVGRRR